MLRTQQEQKSSLWSHEPESREDSSGQRVEEGVTWGLLGIHKKSLEGYWMV